MAVIEIAKIQVRRGQELQTGIPQLDPGEFGWAQDTENLYIGKRIAEGAVDDTNTRILTENDLANIFATIRTGTSVASTATYRYRENSEHIASITSTISEKLDNFVSLTDYNVTPSFTATDITTELRAAVNNLFKNSTWDDWKRQDARRTLTIPAGNYYVSSAIELPPYTRLVGEGKDVTTLILTNPISNVFKTIDAQGNDFESDNMQSGTRKATGIQVENMSLAYSNTMTPTKSLLSLDNVDGAKVRNVGFKTQFTSTSTTTYGFTNYGVGISARGTGDVGVELCRDLLIEDCTFNGLYRAIQGTGTVVRPVIQKNIFTNLKQGIALYTIDTGLGPSNASITDNRFDSIVGEGIYTGQNPGSVRTNHLSSENFFYKVGNGNGLSDYVTTSSGTTPVIRFLSDGNKSINDYFSRRTYANTTTQIDFFYNPLVEGKVSVNDESVYTATIATNSRLEIARFPVAPRNQTINMRYQMTTDNLSRGGVLVVNLDKDANSSFTDTYNYVESYLDADPSTTDMLPIGPSTLSTLYVDATHTKLGDLVGNTQTGYYLTGSDIYLGQVAQVEYVAFDGIQYTIDTVPAERLGYLVKPADNIAIQLNISTSTIYYSVPIRFSQDVTGWTVTGPTIPSGTTVLVTSFTQTVSQTVITLDTPVFLDSAIYTFNRYFDFSTPGETYTLVLDHEPIVYFTIDDTKSSSNNYLKLLCNNGSLLVSADIEYQIDLLT